MANPLLLDIILFLQSQSVVTGDGIDAFRDFTPEEPDSILIVNEYTGSAASLYDPHLHRSVQIVTRSKLADEARSKSVQAFKALQEAQMEDGRVDLTSERWGQVYLRQPPFFLKRDQNDRTYYVFNIGITTTIE